MGQILQHLPGLGGQPGNLLQSVQTHFLDRFRLAQRQSEELYAGYDVPAHHRSGYGLAGVARRYIGAGL